MNNLLEILQSLSDKTRLRIVSLLWKAEDLCSCEIEHILDIKQPTASRHLTKLRQAGLLISYKKAQWIHFRINRTCLRANPFIDHLIQQIHQRKDTHIADDLLRLQDYRVRGYTCATIDQWIPRKTDGNYQ
ncbi:MAG: metalloregulator ArsR/SmtB family transcription factor [Spirochaetales bacterium]|jgi:ArsR family transcriptional regulator|nr:metalloregulator ArsR/SmtB family transcription factor [Spirochaetales bacterium]